MHHLGLIHKDIKPDNIMYSNTMKKCVFIDYGLSHFVW
jgi:serine/threonine protein kinase